MKIEFPSIIEGMPEDEYFGLPYASNSALGTILNRSPLHSRAAYKTASSPAQQLGTLFHLILLQPDLAGEKITMLPESANKTSNVGKRRLLTWMENKLMQQSKAGADLPEGKMLSARIDELSPMLHDRFIVTNQFTYDTVRVMRDAVMKRNISAAIFEQGQAEVSMFAEVADVRCKGRADWIAPALHLICDVKTTQNAGRDAFSRDAARYGYHRQAFFYRRLYAAATYQSEPIFVHLVVESAPPYDVAFFELDTEAIDAGNRQIDEALEIWRRCEFSGIWPGSGWDWENQEYTIQSLSLPRWAL